jgi:hypothetical protein
MEKEYNTVLLCMALNMVKMYAVSLRDNRLLQEGKPFALWLPLFMGEAIIISKEGSHQICLHIRHS